MRVHHLIYIYTTHRVLIPSILVSLAYQLVICFYSGVCSALQLSINFIFDWFRKV